MFLKVNSKVLLHKKQTAIAMQNKQSHMVQYSIIVSEQLQNICNISLRLIAPSEKNTSTYGQLHLQTFAI